MWLLTFWCAFISAMAYISASDGENTKVFRKCCPNNHNLVKVVEKGSDTEERFECVDSYNNSNIFNISNLYPLVVADNITVNYEIPKNCDILHMIQVAEVELSEENENCYDRLIAEVINGSSTQMIPKTVALNCVPQASDDYKLQSVIKIDRLRKCCPPGHTYDIEFHVCRLMQGTSKEDWQIKQLNISHSYIYEVDIGLTCKHEEYSVGLSQKNFRFEVIGSTLNVFSVKGDIIKRVPPEEWCIERQYGDTHFMARVCTADYSMYGAFGVKKCCPIGQHYKPFRCGTLRSRCVPDNHDNPNLFNTFTAYLDPLRTEEDMVIDVLGIRIGLSCPAGKYALNQSSPTDRHWLSPDGRLVLRDYSIEEYCMEAFDVSACDPTQDVVVTSLACFVKAEEKNFHFAAMANTISAVCLLLTLLVYCCLKELRNLHGRTLICHVSTMLLAYSCLARVQFHLVSDNRLCTFLGYGIYFGFVAAFFWLNVMCFDIWWTFGSIQTVQPMQRAGMKKRRFIWYSIYAWGVTCMLTTVLFLLDRYPMSEYLDANMGTSACWFGSEQHSQSDWPHYIFFVIPMGVVTGVNLVFWLLTARHCALVKSELHRLQSGSVGERAKKRFRFDQAKYVLTGKLWVVMGAGWFSELLSTLIRQPQWLWSVVDLINELQGLFIFLILVFKPKVYHLIKRRLGLEKPDPQKNGTSSGRTSSTFLSRTISSDERANLRTSLPSDKQS